MATPSCSLVRSLWLLGAALALTACSPDAENIEVTATIEDASLTIEPSAFGSPTDPQGLPKGSFTLSISLSKYASGSSDVRVDSLALVEASTQQILIPALQVQANAPRNFSVQATKTERFIYNLTYDKPQPIARLCAARQVQYTGTVYDSASKKTKPITGSTITVGGCP